MSYVEADQDPIQLLQARTNNLLFEMDRKSWAPEDSSDLVLIPRCKIVLVFETAYERVNDCSCTVWEMSASGRS